MALRNATISGGGWRNLEWFLNWSSSATAFFLRPEGAKIRVLRGFWFSSQNQTLDGETVKKLSVRRNLLFVAQRMQINVATTSWVTVTFDIEPGSVANLPPEIKF